MKNETKPVKRAAAHAVVGDRARAVKHLAGTGMVVHSSAGRVLSKTLADPDVLVVMERKSAERRADPAALREHYRKLGVLTRAGKLTARYRAG